MRAARLLFISLIRLRCRLLGCAVEGPCCHYCGEHLYNGDLQQGLIVPITDRISALRRKIPHCGQCGKLLPIRKSKRYSDEWCSEQCRDEWLPF